MNQEIPCVRVQNEGFPTYILKMLNRKHAMERNMTWGALLKPKTVLIDCSNTVSRFLMKVTVGVI